MVAAFDITSSSVGGILAQHNPEKSPEIITSSRFETEFFPDFNFQKFQRSIFKTFDRTAAYLKKKMPEGRRKPDAVLVAFSSPWYASKTKLVRLKKPEEFEVSENFISKIIDEETKSFKEEWQKKQNTGSRSAESDELDILESKNMKVSLNGYPVKRFAGKKALSLEFYLYMSMGIKAIKEKVKETISRHFGEGIKTQFHTSPFVFFNVLKNVIDLEKGALIIDVGGEITDVVLIRNGVLEEAISFSKGENFLIRRIASVFRVSPEEASSLLGQYTRGDLHSASKEKMRNIIELAGKEWCQFFKNSLGSPEFSFLPSQIFFIGRGAAAVLKDFVNCEGNQIFSSQLILPEAFKKHFYFARGFGEEKDILLMIHSLFADNFLMHI